MDATIELIHFEGCPNVEATRENLVEALGTLGLGEEWREWDLEDSDTPDRVRRYGSPTVLVNGLVLGTGEPHGQRALQIVNSAPCPISPSNAAGSKAL